MRVLFAGDSLTEGYYATSPRDAFVARTVASWRGAGDVSVLRPQQAHATTTQVDSLVAVQGDLDLAVIELGTNDVDKTPLVKFQQDYARLLDKVESAAPGVPLVCFGTWQQAEDAGPYDAVIQEACTARDGRYVRLSDVFDDAAMRGPAQQPTFKGQSDEFHPNDTGHQVISDRLLATVRFG